MKTISIKKSNEGFAGFDMDMVEGRGKRFMIVAAAALCLAAAPLAGCNTVEGFGEDVEQTGEAIEHEAG